MLPGQMSLWQLTSVKDGPGNLLLKFDHNQVSNSWYNPDMDKCYMDKCHFDTWNLFTELQKEYFCPVSGFSTKNVRTMYLKSEIFTSPIELQKECFCPVSGFSTKNVRNMYFVNFPHDMRHKSKHRLFIFSFIFICRWTVSQINIIVDFLYQIC